MSEYRSNSDVSKSWSPNHAYKRQRNNLRSVIDLKLLIIDWDAWPVCQWCVQCGDNELMIGLMREKAMPGAHPYLLPPRRPDTLRLNMIFQEGK